MECNGVLNFLYKTNFRKTQMLYLNYWYEIKNVEEKCQIRYRIGRNATPKLQNLLKKQQNLPPHSPSENGCFGMYHIGQNRYHDST